MSRLDRNYGFLVLHNLSLEDQEKELELGVGDAIAQLGWDDRDLDYAKDPGLDEGSVQLFLLGTCP